MAEQRLLFIDIEPRSNSSAPAEDRVQGRLWTRSDNTFKFNFLPDNAPALQEKTSSDRAEPSQTQISLTGEGSAFAFNFQIPVVQDVEMSEMPDTSPVPSSLQEGNPPPELSEQSKAKKKKKKKSGKNKASDGAEAQQKPAEASGGSEETELSTEEQLNRELDWCIEQLELGLRSQKGTPKQKEEASRALKTLRSSKAPLVKKRQVMRAMNGEYRKKMEEEKNKQFKLIHSEIASAQVKAVSDSPKKSVFRQKAKVKTQTPATDVNQQQTKAPDAQLTTQTQETSAFVFTASKEQFTFNFL